MQVKELIKTLQKQDPEAEVMLWRWGGKGSVWSFFAELCPHKSPEGVYELGVNELMPNLYDRAELEEFVKEMNKK